MTSKAIVAVNKAGREPKYIAEIDEGLAEIAILRRDMKKTDAQIRRLETSTRRTLGQIRANLHVEKAA